MSNIPSVSTRCEKRKYHDTPFRSWGFYRIDLGQWKRETYLPLDMPEIDPQLLQQRRLPLIPLRPERRQPARPQPPLLPHPSTHARRAGSAKAAEPPRRPIAPTVGIAVRLLLLLLATVAVLVAAAVGVLGLRGGAVAGDGGGVGGLVEVEVLGLWVVGLGGGGVVLGHCGQGGGR